MAGLMWPLRLTLFPVLKWQNGRVSYAPRGDAMSVRQQELNSVIPDLRNVSLERLAKLGDCALAQSIALYGQRLKETAAPLSSFNARI